MQAFGILPDSLHHPSVVKLLRMSLAEDLSPDDDTDYFVNGDVTSVATLKPDTHLIGHMRAKAQGVVAGLSVAAAVFALVDLKINFEPQQIVDGVTVQPGDLLAIISGPGAALLAGERVALNFLGRMSGVATLTRCFVDAIAGTKAVILDTRKTIPGWRLLDKYAVIMGGGQNHRHGLFDMVLIKDNHIDGSGGISSAVESVRKRYGDKYSIEVEVKNMDELQEALSLLPERIMLDNMTLDEMRQAVKIADGRVPLEASGNVTLEMVRTIAETGVDYISIGALTHSAPVLDISMRLG